jgi:hypothetical protein
VRIEERTLLLFQTEHPIGIACRDRPSLLPADVGHEFELDGNVIGEVFERGIDRQPVTAIGLEDLFRGGPMTSPVESR